MPRPRAQILVCVNDRPPGSPKASCAPVGGKAVLRRFKELARELGLKEQVMVVRSGCLKHCSRGVTVAVWPYNFWYANVTVDDAEEILRRSALAGEEVERLRMPDIPWE